MPKFRANFSEENAIAVFSDGKRSYQDFADLLIDRHNGTLKELSTSEADETIRAIFCEVCGLDPEVEYKKSEYRKAVRRNMPAIFEVVEEIVPYLLQTGWQADPFFKKFVEYRNLNDGDTNVFYTEEPTILTVSKIARGSWQLERQRLKGKKRFTVATEAYGVAIYAEFERLMMGLENWSELISKIAEGFQKKINDELYVSVMSASKSLPNGTQFVKNLDFTAKEDTREAINELCDDIERATGRKVVIMGTGSALSKLNSLTPIDYYSDGMKDELHRTGKLGIWEGREIAEIPQAFAPNDLSKKLVDDKSLLVMPEGDNRFVKFVNEGDAQVKETNDGTTNNDMSSDYKYVQQIGIAVVISMLFGHITVKK